MDPLKRQPETATLEHILTAISFPVDAITTVMDLGSRDGIEAAELARIFPKSNVIAVECNPPAIEMVVDRIRGNPRLSCLPYAINSYNGVCQFYAIDSSKTVTPWIDGNIGASSLYRANGSYPHETYVQRAIEVPCLRGDTICETLQVAPQVLWMDLQGAELTALQSFGKYLDAVQLIWTEVSHKAAYDGQCLFPELDRFLTNRGFVRATEVNDNMYQHDALYLRSTK